MATGVVLKSHTAAEQEVELMIHNINQQIERDTQKIKQELEEYKTQNTDQEIKQTEKSPTKNEATRTLSKNLSLHVPSPTNEFPSRSEYKFQSKSPANLDGQIPQRTNSDIEIEGILDDAIIESKSNLHPARTTAATGATGNARSSLKGAVPMVATQDPSYLHASEKVWKEALMNIFSHYSQPAARGTKLTLESFKPRVETVDLKDWMKLCADFGLNPKPSVTSLSDDRKIVLSSLFKKEAKGILGITYLDFEVGMTIIR